MKEEDETSSKTPSIAKGVFAGGVFGGLTAVVIAQKLSSDVEGSQSLTLLAVAAGFAVGAVLGFLFVRAKQK